MTQHNLRQLPEGGDHDLASDDPIQRHKNPLAAGNEPTFFWLGKKLSLNDAGRSVGWTDGRAQKQNSLPLSEFMYRIFCFN